MPPKSAQTKGKEKMVDAPATDDGIASDKNASTRQNSRRTKIQQEVEKLKKNVSFQLIQLTTSMNGLIRPEPQSNNHRVLNSPEFLNDPSRYVIFTETFADGSRKQYFNGPFERHNRLPSYKELMANSGKDASSMADSAPETNTNQTKSGIHTASSQEADDRNDTATKNDTGSGELLAVREMENPRAGFVASDQNIDVHRTLDHQAEAIVTDQDLDVQHIPSLPDMDQILEEKATSGATDDGPRSSIEDLKAQQETKGKGGKKDKPYEPEHWLWMHDWARSNRQIRHRNEEMAKAFNKQFDDVRTANAMKGRFQALNESGHLNGPPKDLNFYNNAKNIPKKRPDNERNGGGKAKEEEPKEEEPVEEDPKEVKGTELAQASGPLKLRKRARSDVEDLESMELAVELEMASPPPRKKARNVIPKPRKAQPVVPRKGEMSDVVMEDVVDEDAPRPPMEDLAMSRPFALSALLPAVAGGSAREISVPTSETPRRAAASISPSYTGTGFTSVNASMKSKLSVSGSRRKSSGEEGAEESE